MSRIVYSTLLALSIASVASAAEKAVLVNFEEQPPVGRNNIQTRSQLVRSEGGFALQITTEAGAHYPGVVLKSSNGKWDLGNFDAVEMDVINPQDVPLRVLLSLNGPGADGTRNCNVESVNIPARGRGKLVVPYGMWHGSTGRDIDWSNIITMMVMLDQPKHSHTFLVDNIRGVKHNRMTIEQAMADPYFSQLKAGFGRGVNLGNALDAPNEGEWGVKLEEGYFDLIRSAGFDSVRVPIRWSNHAGWSKPYKIDPQFMARVEWVVRNCLSRRLIPIINVHHYNELNEKPLEHRERFVALWEQISVHFKDYPSALAFELCNEPHGNLNADLWNRMLAETLAVVRRTNPARKVVVGPTDWNSLKALNRLELPEDDRNLVVTFHYYSPFKFTHQGASWVGNQSRAWLGTKWTGSEAEKDEVRKDMDQAILWAVANRRPIYMGEFGAYSKADIESRTRWTRFVAEEATKRKISTAYWEFCASFGVYNPDEKKWVEPLRKALLGERP